MRNWIMRVRASSIGPAAMLMAVLAAIPAGAQDYVVGKIKISQVWTRVPLRRRK